MPNTDKVIDEVTGSVGLGILLVSGISHSSVAETFHTNLTHELLSVFVSSSSDIIVRREFLFPTPGIKEILNIPHSG